MKLSMVHSAVPAGTILRPALQRRPETHDVLMTPSLRAGATSQTTKAGMQEIFRSPILTVEHNTAVRSKSVR